MIHLSSYHSNGLPTVVWPNKVNLIGEKVYKPKIHFCEHCNKPILIYGRLIPCKHVFCFSCATLCLSQQQQQQQQTSLAATIQQDLSLDSPASNNSNALGPPGTPAQPPPNGNGKGCHRCGGRALRVERNILNSIFVCHIESCRRTYLSARDLQAHVNHRHSKNKSNSNHSGTASASLAAISSSPYISSSSLLHLNNHNNSSSSGSNNHNNSINNNSNQARQSSAVNHSGNNNNSPNYHHQQHHNRHERDSHPRNRDRDRFRERDIYQRDRDRERDSKEYHRQSIQRAAQWAEASAQMLEKGFSR